VIPNIAETHLSRNLQSRPKHSSPHVRLFNLEQQIRRIHHN